MNYCSGETLMKGDLIRVSKKIGKIENIILKETPDSHEYDCFDTGGILISFTDGDLQLWREPDEDLEFVERAVS